MQKSRKEGIDSWKRAQPAWTAWVNELALFKFYTNLCDSMVNQKHHGAISAWLREPFAYSIIVMEYEFFKSILNDSYFNANVNAQSVYNIGGNLWRKFKLWISRINLRIIVFAVFSSMKYFFFCRNSFKRDHFRSKFTPLCAIIEMRKFHWQSKAAMSL